MFGQVTSIPFPKEGESTAIIDVNPMYRMPLIFVNLFVFIISCVISVICILALADRADTISFSHKSVLVNLMVNLEVPILLFFGTLLLISFVGFMGSLRENLTMLSWYGCILTGLGYITLALLFFFAGIPFVSRNSARGLFEIDLITSYRDNPDYARLIDYAQASFQCCGVTDERYRSWGQNIYFKCSTANPSKERCSVPASCCKPPDVKNPDFETKLQGRYCGRGVLRMTEQQAFQRIYTRSCVDATVAYITSNVFMIAVVLVGVLIMFGVLRCLTQKVSNEVTELTKMYDKYYEKKEMLQAAELADLTAAVEEPPQPAVQESGITQPDVYRTGAASLAGSQMFKEERAPNPFLQAQRPMYPRPMPPRNRLF